MSKKVESDRASDVEVVDEDAKSADTGRMMDRFDLFNLPPFGDLARWPSWPGLRWPDRMMGDFSEMLDHIRIEEYVEDDKFVVRGEIPGVDPDSDIDISIDGRRMSIRATRQSRTEKSEDNVYRSEFRYGSLSRVVDLPEHADVDAVEANYVDGILEVVVPLESGDGHESKKVKINRG